LFQLFFYDTNQPNKKEGGMAGFQEILIVVAIILGIFFIPRVISKKPALRAAKSKKKISGNMRIAIAATLIYPIFPAVYFQPWHRNLVLFVLIGIMPVLLGWLAVWVYDGFRKS
jgi:uncharacterized membrane protein (DUF4010 family)